MTRPDRRPRAAPATAPGDPARAEVEERIRRQALVALAKNRVPGYHFPGHFLDLRCRRFEREGVVLAMPEQPHAVEPDGTVNFHALALLADMTLAACNRIFVPPTIRTATLEMHMTFTGLPPRGDMHCEARSEGFTPHATLQQAYCRGRLYASDEVIAHLSGTWVAPPIPGGGKLAPLPWERGSAGDEVPELPEHELDAGERRVLHQVEAALLASRDGTGFLKRFWSEEAHHTATGSRGTYRIGMHTGNRVGHVQGGLLAAFAVATARAAVPRHALLTSLSSWFISPGEGRSLTSRSQVLQLGRNVAVVRTQVFGARRKRVFEAISSHAVPAHDRGTVA
jgi:acyl-coenzyme A thioesterase PaaI-like protein